MRASEDDRVICDSCPICETTIGPLKLKLDRSSTGSGIFNKFQIPSSHKRCFGGEPGRTLDVSLPGPFKVTLTQKVKNELGVTTSTLEHILELRRFSGSSK